ncbi:YhbD family protein [Falsibacillus pallidus]|uniref:YhbD family protein n=1 Tax=Falsibacillus pallidus TaxID=493781 RepID=UPI003D991D4C
MSHELISKKDLLDLTGISYGQLYRWKRKNLIPEDWFIRKSTFTGQETFFPKQKILERIEKIQTMKENLSLDELADMFSPAASSLKLTAKELISKGVASESVMNFFLDQTGVSGEFPFEEILNLYMLSSMLESGDIQLDEGRMLLELLKEHSSQLQKKDSIIIFIRKLGISSCLILMNGEEVFFEKGTKMVARLSITKCMEELKTKLL